MYRKLFNISLIVTLAFSVALAQKPGVATSVSVERLREHVNYLASDKLQGRRTGTPGAVEAAQYVASEFSRLRLMPGKAGQDGKSSRAKPTDYLQPFRYVAGVDLAQGNSLNSGSTSLRVSEDWMPLGLSSNGKVEARTVFGGYSIKVAELNYNDYAGIDAKDKIVIALSGTPDGDNPHSQFARYEDPRWKAVAARNAGAKALILITPADNLKGTSAALLTYDNSAGDAGLPVVVITRQAAMRLLPSLKMEDLEAATKSKDYQTVNRSPVTISLNTQLSHREVPASNVIGILEGSDPVLKNEAIVIGAHYDHLGLGGLGSLFLGEGQVHHGADDNASGTAGMLELARVFAGQRPRPRRTIVFIAFGGEEEGLLGSSYYVNHPVVPIANTVAMINMDMIGRMKSKSLIIGGVGTAPEWRSMIEAANAMQGMTVTATSGSSSPTLTGGGMPMVVAANGRTIVSSDSSKLFQLTLNEDGFGPSDHSSFYGKQVPVLFFWTGTHEDYHKPSDTADKLNYEDEAQILALAGRIVRDIAAADKRPTYTTAKAAPAPRGSGFRVYLGTVPNYADSNDGLLLDGVREDSPAAKAGLKAGDKIVKLAGLDVRNVYDYTAALGEMKAGQEYEVELMRGGQRLTLKLTPAAKKP